jgi:hypothetical protein
MREKESRAQIDNEDNLNNLSNIHNNIMYERKENNK